MEQYLGICMVIVVTGIVLGVLARLITGGILDEIERVKKRKFDNRCKSIGNLIKGCSKYIDKYINNCKTAIELDKKYGREGQKYADKAFKETWEEMKNDFELKND